jgi:hypothetical protein
MDMDIKFNRLLAPIKGIGSGHLLKNLPSWKTGKTGKTGVAS